MSELDERMECDHIIQERKSKKKKKTGTVCEERKVEMNLDPSMKKEILKTPKSSLSVYCFRKLIIRR